MQLGNKSQVSLSFFSNLPYLTEEENLLQWKLFLPICADKTSFYENISCIYHSGNQILFVLAICAHTHMPFLFLLRDSCYIIFKYIHNMTGYLE